MVSPSSSRCVFVARPRLGRGKSLAIGSWNKTTLARIGQPILSQITPTRAPAAALTTYTVCVYNGTRRPRRLLAQGLTALIPLACGATFCGPAG